MNNESFRLVGLELFNHKLLENSDILPGMNAWASKSGYSSIENRLKRRGFTPITKLVKLDFFRIDNTIDVPVTTLIIGPNGTGKSEILRAVVQIFREIFYQKQGKKFDSQYKYILKYFLNGDNYEINRKEGKKVIYKNGEMINISELEIPKKVLASTFILNDKFPFPKKRYLENNPQYEYLGLRTQSGAAGTRSYLKKLVENLIDSLGDPSFIGNIKDMFDFLNLRKEMTIYYHPKFRKYLFTGNLTLLEMDEFFLNWKKRRDTKPFSTNRYEKLTNEVKEDIVRFINESNSRIRKDGRSYFFEYHIDFNDIRSAN